MKLKYYLRGMGIGIIVTTLILMIAYGQRNVKLTDAEIIQRAEVLGMVMKEDSLFPNRGESTEMVEEAEQADDIETTESLQNVVNTEQINTEMESTETSNSTEQDVTEIESEINSEAGQESEQSEINEGSENTLSGEVYRIMIPAGSVPRLICNELEEHGVISSASELRKYLADMGLAKLIGVGEYDIPYGATYEEIYLILKAGPN